MPTQNRRGFTLIELLVVVAVLAILIAVLLPGLAGARRAAQQTTSLIDMRTIGTTTYAYANDHHNKLFPTARMPGMGPNRAPFSLSWVYLTGRIIDPTLAPLQDFQSPAEIARFVDRLEVFRSPADPSTNWDDPMMPRLGSYGINAYLTPNHPPYNGIRVTSLRQPSSLVLAVELAPEIAMDHVMPMYWGDPPAVDNAMISSRQWDRDTQTPKVMAHDRHPGETSNMVFADGHAKALTFAETWIQTTGQRPTRNRYDPKRP